MNEILALGKTAKKFGLKKGDEIVAIGGHPFTDVLDYYFFDGEEQFDVEVKRGNKQKLFHVKKAADASLDLEINSTIEPAHCKNNCMFCFVSQLPKGMRGTLYVKDDDYRLSFISGSYITLTNLAEKDIERIIRLKLSPLYISVHAYDPDVRVKLLKNPHTRELFSIMKRLIDAGIEMHTQIVVCEGINDGAVMVETIEKLHELHPSVKSVAVVPVGLTGHREGLPDLKPISSDSALKTIKTVEELHVKYNGFCWCADEYYLNAGKKIPSFEYYEEFPQIENGVGLVADFRLNFEESLEKEADRALKRKVLFATGVSFFEELEHAAAMLKTKFLGLEIETVRVENDFFGHTVTVAGLLTGRDILKALKGKKADFLVLPKNMLKEFDTVFLDGMSVDDLSKELEMPVKISRADGADLAQVVSGSEK